MATPRKYNRGDRVRIPAQFMNDTLDLIRAAKGRPGSLLSGNSNPAIVRVKNGTASFQEANTMLSISNGTMVEVDTDANVPTANLGKFRAGNFVLVADAPVTNQSRYFCVLAEALRSGEIGNAWISGIVPVIVSMLDDAHAYATLVLESGTWYLESLDLGPFPIRYKEQKNESTGTPEDVWALIQLNSAFGVNGFFAQATSDPQSDGTLTVKLATSDGTLVGNDLTVYDGGM